jgi:hypothetical protein
MKRFLQLIDRSPLAVSIVALLASFPSLQFLIVHEEGHIDGRVGAAILALSLIIPCVALVNLAKAVGRGYSATRILLTLTVLLFAVMPPTYLGVVLVTMLGESQ